MKQMAGFFAVLVLGTLILVSVAVVNNRSGPASVELREAARSYGAVNMPLEESGVGGAYYAQRSGQAGYFQDSNRQVRRKVSEGRLGLKAGLDSSVGRRQQQKVATSAEMRLETPHRNWTDCRQNLVALVDRFAALITRQEEAEGIAENDYSLSLGRYVIDVPSASFDAFIVALKEGYLDENSTTKPKLWRFGKVTLLRTKKMAVDLPMENIAVEIQLTQANFERLQKLLEEAKTLQEKLDVNRLILEAEKELRYLKSTAAQLEGMVEYSKLRLELAEGPKMIPYEVPVDNDKPLRVVVLLAFVLSLMAFSYLHSRRDAARERSV